MVRVASGFRSTLRSDRAQPKPEAPGSTSRPRWRRHLRQEARLSHSDRTHFRQLQLSLGTLRPPRISFSQDWAMSGAVTQLFVATAQSQSKLVLQLVKAAEFPLYVGQFFLRPALHRRARLQAIPPQPKEPPNLVEFDSRALPAAHKGRRLYVVLPVWLEATLRSWRSREQAVALVEANRVDAQPYLFRDNANLHDLSPSPESYPV